MKEDESKASQKYWLDQITASTKRLKDWHGRGDKIIERYRDEREGGQKKINILWSNIEILKPALYARPPKANVKRRFLDAKDEQRGKIARETSTVMERALDFHIEAFDFHSLAESCVEDYLLPGFAVARVDYNPTFGEEKHERTLVNCEDDQYITESGESVDLKDVLSDDDGLYMNGESYKEVVFEQAELRYTPWKHFRMGEAKRWEDMPWVAFGESLDRQELVDRFGDVGKKISLSSDDDDNESSEKKALVWEIWHKRKNKVIWMCESYKDGVLDERDPHITLRNFFPCPAPLIASQTNSSMIPVPDFCQYQDQADELDSITARIEVLVKAMRVVGVYDASAESLSGMLTGEDNQMIPVEDWAMFADKGGVKGQVDWFPLDQVAKVLMALYDARARTKEELYEVSGLSDILRGQVDPDEKLGQSRIKAQVGSARMNKKQGNVALFLRDLLRLQAEVIAENFSEETLEMMTGVTITPEIMDVLKSDVLREFNINIETDSTVLPDEQAEQQSRISFLETAGGFLEKAVPLTQTSPELAPLLGEMLLFGVRGFKTGRSLEETFEEAVEGLRQEEGEQTLDPQMEAMHQQAEQQIQALQQQLQELSQAHEELQKDRSTELQTATIDAQADIEKARIKAQADQIIAQIKAGGNYE